MLKKNFYAKHEKCPYCGEKHIYKIPNSGWMKMLLDCTNYECRSCGGEYIRVLGLISIPTFRTKLSITPYRHKHS